MRLTDLNEKKIRLEDSQAVLENPTLSELRSFLLTCREQSVRGFTDGTNVYVWDAMYATHYQMTLKIPFVNALTQTSFFIANDKANVSPTWEAGRWREIEEVNGLFVCSYAKTDISPYDVAYFLRMLGAKD
jgi:hypothetical protein